MALTKDQQAFLDRIAPLVQEFAPQYGIKVASPIIAQAILESGWGTSELGKNANNFFGLKWRQGRTPTASGTYTKVGSEQKKDGTYVKSTMLWAKFKNDRDGVQGYFDFINVDNYKALKGVTDPHTYLELIHKAGYATSLKYVDNVYTVITRNGLTKYDEVLKTPARAYTNSPLVTYTKISPNKTPNRKGPLDMLVIHCMAGELSVESCGNLFAASSRQASSNYGVDSQGHIGLYVEEKDRSWCSSSGAVDHRAITIEVASDKKAPYAFTDMSMYTLKRLVLDICKRNGFNKLVWLESKEKVDVYKPKKGELLMSAHRYYSPKDCPGDWFYNQEGAFADELNTILAGKASLKSPEEKAAEVLNLPKTPFTVRVLVDDLNYRTTPSMNGAIKGVTKKGVFTITQVTNGWGKLASGVGYIWLGNPKYVEVNRIAPVSKVEEAAAACPYKVKVNVAALNVRKSYNSSSLVTGVIRDKGIYTIVEERSGFGKLKSGLGWIELKYTKRV